MKKWRALNYHDVIRTKAFDGALGGDSLISALSAVSPLSAQ